MPGVNRTVFNRRRASTDAVNLPFDQNLKLNRRMSDLSFKASLVKGRQNRLVYSNKLVPLCLFSVFQYWDGVE